MTQEQQEAFDAVQKINQELYETYSKNENAEFKRNLSLDLLPVVSITFANDMTFIKLTIQSYKNYLPEFSLYSSIDDDRIFYEKSNKYETFYKLIKRKFLEVKKEINSVKL